MTGGLNWAAVEKLLRICGRGRPSKDFAAAEKQTVTILKFFPCSRTGKRFEALPQKSLHCELRWVAPHSSAFTKTLSSQLEAKSLDTRITPTSLNVCLVWSKNSNPLQTPSNGLFQPKLKCMVSTNEYCHYLLIYLIIIT